MATFPPVVIPLSQPAGPCGIHSMKQVDWVLSAACTLAYVAESMDPVCDLQGTSDTYERCVELFDELISRTSGSEITRLQELVCISYNIKARGGTESISAQPLHYTRHASWCTTSTTTESAAPIAEVVQLRMLRGMATRLWRITTSYCTSRFIV